MYHHNAQRIIVVSAVRGFPCLQLSQVLQTESWTGGERLYESFCCAAAVARTVLLLLRFCCCICAKFTMQRLVAGFTAE